MELLLLWQISLLLSYCTSLLPFLPMCQATTPPLSSSFTFPSLSSLLLASTVLTTLGLHEQACD